VQFIPLTVLINPEGIIVEKGLNVHDLKEKILKLIK